MLVGLGKTEPAAGPLIPWDHLMKGETLEECPKMFELRGRFSRPWFTHIEIADTVTPIAIGCIATRQRDRPMAAPNPIVVLGMTRFVQISFVAVFLVHIGLPDGLILKNPVMDLSFIAVLLSYEKSAQSDLA
jgi:hypothetical protein